MKYRLRGGTVEAETVVSRSDDYGNAEEHYIVKRGLFTIQMSIEMFDILFEPVPDCEYAKEGHLFYGAYCCLGCGYTQEQLDNKGLTKDEGDDCDAD